jgi:hypothetical protein
MPAPFKAFFSNLPGSAPLGAFLHPCSPLGRIAILRAGVQSDVNCGNL